MVAAVHKLAIVPDEAFLRNVTPDTYVNTVVIAAAGTEQVMTIPAGAKRVLFGATGNFCVRYNATGGGTGADFTAKADGTGCEINPAGAFLKGVAELSIDATANGTVVSGTFYL